MSYIGELEADREIIDGNGSIVIYGGVMAATEKKYFGI